MAGEPGTKALGTDLVEQSRITDVWIIQYNLDTKKIVGSPQLYLISELGGSIPVVMPPKGSTYQFIAIANTKDDSVEFASKADIDLLHRFSIPVRNLDDLYKYVTEDGVKKLDLLMNGEITVYNDNGTYRNTADNSVITGLDFQMYRNVAKLTLKVKNESTAADKVHIKSVRLCNIPNKVFYTELFRNSSDYSANPAPTTAEASFFNLPADNCELNSGNTAEMTFTYYLPRNCRGTKAESTTSDSKNTYADANATYVEILANKEDGSPLRYRFYLGEDMVKDFNVKPNYHYILPVTITSAGDNSDSRVENLGSVKLTEANSYIINPLGGSYQSVYHLPVSNRVNHFWDTVKGDANGKITADTEWIAEVIWQDVQGRQLIEFCDKNGNVAVPTMDGGNYDVSKAPYIYEGKGLGHLYFKPKAGVEGNVLIGVKFKKDADKYNQYLWSWHLWITDYNPDEVKDKEWGEDYRYSVTGGEVHRYDDADSRTTWSETYKGKWIMDRNLGALEESFTGFGDDFYRVMGMFYQWGRKDPFPRYTYINASALWNSTAHLYDILGNALYGRLAYNGLSSATKDYTFDRTSSGKATIENSIQMPHVFAGFNGSWSSNDYPGNIWNNPQAYKTAIEEEKGHAVTKSLFDPCPPGWQVPENGTWSAFTYDPVKDKFNRGYYFPIGAGSATAFYPAAGHRKPDNALLQNAGSNGVYWSSTPSSANNGYSVSFTSVNVSTEHYGAGRAYGYQVRCVQE